MVANRPALGHVSSRPGRPGDVLENGVQLLEEGVGGGAERGRVELVVTGPDTRIRAKRVAVGLAVPQRRGPRLDDPEVIQGVPMECHVDPAPGDIASDQVHRQAPDRLHETGMSVVQPFSGGRGRKVGPQRPTRLVESIEVAAPEVGVRGPVRPTDCPGHIVDRDLLPICDVGDMVKQRPVGATGVRRGRPGIRPGSVVDPGPTRSEAAPQGRFVGPEVALHEAEVEGAKVREGRPPQTFRGGQHRRVWIRHDGRSPGD